MVASAIIGAVSSNQAASAQEKAANEAENTQMKMFNTAQQGLQPYEQGGQAALGTLNNLLSPNSTTAQNTLQSLPGYQFALNQGLQATQAGAAARGLGTSGAALKGAATYATGLAQQNYTNYANTLQNLVNTGEGAAGSLGQAAVATGQGIASSQTGAGNAAAAGDIGTGTSFTNWLQGANIANYLMASNGKGIYSTAAAGA